MEDSKLIHHLFFLTLHKSCQATSNHFSLLGYFEGHSTENIGSHASDMLKDYNISDLRVWDDINDLFLLAVLLLKFHLNWLT